MTLLFALTGGRPYCISGILPLLWAVSAAEVEAGRAARWWRWIPTWPVHALTALVVLGVLDELPIRRPSVHADQPLQPRAFQRDEIGWPEMVDDVAAAHRALPPDVARDAVVVTGDHWTVSDVRPGPRPGDGLQRVARRGLVRGSAGGVRCRAPRG